VTNFAGVVDQASGYFGSTNIYADYIIILATGWH
jgi:hypothetical protein